MKINILENLNYEDYMQRYNVSSLLAKTLASKDLDDKTIKELLNNRVIYHDFDLFLEGEMALDRIHEAIDNKEKICIYGDYDCDGILATSILVNAFKQLGVEVGFHIPNRFSDGYGLNENRVQQIAQKGYSLIITVDNGVKANEAIDKANELGVDVIVSDHHEYDELPNALCVIHTKMSPDYPFKGISGGFVAYKLAVALLGKQDKYLYTLAAITTISDMMPLLDENRSLVIKGIELMKENKFTQLELLLGNNQIYDSQKIGFVIAPKINSFGRLPDLVNPNHLVSYFKSDCNISLLNKIALEATKINEKRKDMTASTYKKVMQEYDDGKCLFYYDEDIHEGLVGLVAGKFSSQYNKPSFVMKVKNDVIHGSARGVAGVKIPELFDYCKDYLITYGGHDFAGGFSLKKDDAVKLKDKINEYLDTITISEEEKNGILITNQELTLNNIKDLKRLEPFGNANEEPLFVLKGCNILKIMPLSNGKHLKFILDNGVEALLFNVEDSNAYKNKTQVDIAGKISINKYLNKETINIIIENIK